MSNMIECKLLTSRVGNRFSQRPGDVVRVSLDEAGRLFEAGMASPIDKEDYDLAIEAAKKVEAQQRASATRRKEPAQNESENESGGIPIGELDLPGGVVQILADAGIATVDALLEYANDQRLDDLEGIGEATATKISEALEAIAGPTIGDDDNEE